MIRVRKRNEGNSLYVNDTFICKSNEYRYGTKRKLGVINILSKEASEKIISFSLAELIPFKSLYLSLDFVWPHIDKLEISGSNDIYSLVYTFLPEASTWTKPYSIKAYIPEFYNSFKRVALKGSKTSFPNVDSGVSKSADNYHKNFRLIWGYPINFEFTSTNVIVRDFIVQTSNLLLKIHEEVDRKLIGSEHSISKSFDFPEEVRVYCEQYLIYFVQFLKDLGVEATHEIKHKAGEVLFTVKPNDPNEGLDKIRTALEVYLNLPASPVSNDMNNEIAIQRMESTILRLHSDLKLAAAEIQMKNATIQTQAIAIKLLSGDVVMNSVKDATPPKPDEGKEDILGGTVTLKPLDIKAANLNTAEIYRRIKKLFKREE